MFRTRETQRVMVSLVASSLVWVRIHPIENNKPNNKGHGLDTFFWCFVFLFLFALPLDGTKFPTVCSLIIIANPPRSDICSRSTHSLCVYQQRQPQPQQHFITMTERKSSPYDPQMELLHKVLDE